MNTLLILYLVYLSWGTAGQGRVSFLEMSRYLRNSKTDVRNKAFKLADDGLLEIIETVSAKGSRKLFMSLTDVGNQYLLDNFEAAQGQYHIHVAATIEAIAARHKGDLLTPRPMTKKQRQALLDGQKEMF